MIEPMQMKELVRIYPILGELSEQLIADLQQTATSIEVPAGTILFDEGTRCTAFPMVIDGRIRVERQAESGRKILLYTVDPGDSCILTVSALLGGGTYRAIGVAESDVQGVVIPDRFFHSLIVSDRSFRSFVFRFFSDRITSLMMLIENLAWQNVRQRLAGMLGMGPGTVQETHQTLADRLGTVREVVSRTLKQFESNDLIRIGRKQIHVLDPDGLKKIAST